MKDDGKKIVILFCVMMAVTLNVNAQGWYTNLQENLEFKGVVLEDKDYHIWGSSPIWGDDGKVHVFSARFPINMTTKNHSFNGWRNHSEIAHYVGDKPEGPFTYVETLTKPDPSKKEKAWGTKHNPTISKAGDKFVLVYIASGEVRGFGIYMMTADDINGPWKKVGLVLSATKDPNVWSYSEPAGMSANPVFIHNPNNGKSYIYYKTRMGPKNTAYFGVAVADKLEGPYIHHPKKITENKGYIEDPCGFYYNNKFYLLFRQGFWLTSDDGLYFDFNNKIEAHEDKLGHYIDKEVAAKATRWYGTTLERPQFLLTDGIPSHLFMPAGMNINGGNGTACYMLRIKPDAE
ncbi:glycoside hydrolase family protein [Verrucomicrobiota bacterium]